MTATRTEAFAALAKLNAAIKELDCAALINDAKYVHEIDNGYGALATAADVVKPLAASLFFARAQVVVNINDGCYQWAVDGARRAEGEVHGIRNIEMRIKMNKGA